MFDVRCSAALPYGPPPHLTARRLTPSRGGLLPARPPLRTVRESFPSYGSSPHKARLSEADPRPSGHPPAKPLGHSGIQPSCTVALGQQLRDASTDGRRSSFAFSGGIGSVSLLAISDQTDVGLSSALHAGLGFFGPPNAAPPDPPCGEVCRPRGRTGPTAFPCSANGTG